MKKYIKPISEMPAINLRDYMNDVTGANTTGNGDQGAKSTDQWEPEQDDAFDW